MAGITIGVVFSVIGVMTTVTALRGSIETGLSFLGADTFQIAKSGPTGVQAITAKRNQDKIPQAAATSRFAQAQRFYSAS